MNGNKNYESEMLDEAFNLLPCLWLFLFLLGLGFICSATFWVTVLGGAS